MTDWFAEAFGAAVSDIRTKLIDEAFFGRRPAPHAPSIHAPEGTEDYDRTGERDGRSHDLGIDR